MATFRHGRQLVLLAVAVVLVLLVGSADAWNRGCGGRYPCPKKPYAFGKCLGGQCKYWCNPGYADCDNNWMNGCEVCTSSDPKNCGGCNKMCQWGEKCKNGYCVKPPCRPGWGNCDGRGCKNLDYDNFNCGKCGIKCPCSLKFGEAICKWGKCYEQCKSGWKFDHVKNCCIQGW